MSNNNNNNAQQAPTTANPQTINDLNIAMDNTKKVVVNNLKHMYGEQRKLRDRIAEQIDNNLRYETAIDNLEMQISDLNEEIDFTQSKTNKHIHDLNNRIKHLKNTTDTINSSITSFKSQISDLNKNMEDVQRAISDLETIYNNAQTATSSVSFFNALEIWNTFSLNIVTVLKNIIVPLTVGSYTGFWGALITILSMNYNNIGQVLNAIGNFITQNIRTFVFTYVESIKAYNEYRKINAEIENINKKTDAEIRLIQLKIDSYKEIHATEISNASKKTENEISNAQLRAEIEALRKQNNDLMNASRSKRETHEKSPVVKNSIAQRVVKRNSKRK